MEIIQQIIHALNHVEVRGADNMDRLLASIQGLERLNEAMEAERHDDNNEQRQDVPGPMD